VELAPVSLLTPGGKETMLTIEQAAEAVGLSDRQLRRRIEATSPLLAPHCRRGEKNRLLLDHGAVEILRAVEDHRKTGVTLKDAVALVQEQLGGSWASEQGRAGGQTGGRTVEDTDSSLVAELRDRIRFLESENGRLWSLVDDLKALPAPRTRRWWPFGRKTSW